MAAMPRLATLIALAAIGGMAGGCTVLAVGGAVVGAGVTVASTAVSAGVAVGKGVVNVATAPFGSGKDK
jgi:hypothetical protein